MNARYGIPLALGAALGVVASSTSANTPRALPQDYNPARSLAPLVENLSPAVVSVTIAQSLPVELDQLPSWMQIPEGAEEQLRTGQGSGFLISADGYLLTNNHVVSEAESVTVTLQDGRSFDADVIGTDENLDIALVRIEDTAPLPYVELGQASRSRVGDWVVAIGNPFGLDHTVTSGIVSGKGRRIGAGPYDAFLQTDASINPGNSGGPLFNLSGEVVGINTAIVGQGIGFAVPVDMVKGMLEDLKTDGRVARGWVGVGLRDLDDQMALRLGVDPSAEGVVLTQVYPDTPAAKAGARAGDVLVKLEGQPVSDSGEVVRSIGAHRPGEKVSMEILRDGKRKTLKVELGQRPDESALARGSWRDPQDTPDAGVDATRSLGIGVRDARAMGIRDGVGVVVIRVDEDGPAAGRLRAGDRIIEANRRPIRTGDDLGAALAQSDEGVMLVVERRGGQVLVDIPFGD